MKELQRNVLLVVASVLLGGSLMSYKAYAQKQNTVQPVERLTVFDSKGKRIGNILGIEHNGGRPVVALSVNGRLVTLYVAPTGFGGSLGTVVASMLFLSSSCTGTPYYFYGPDDLMPFTLLHGTKLYVPDGSPQTLTFDAYLRPDGTCTPISDPQPIYATAMKFFFDLSTQFQPPFRLGQSAGTP